MVIILYKKI